MSSAEQQARDLLERLEVDGAQNYSSGEIVELANLVAERNKLAREVAAMPDRTFVDDRGFTWEWCGGEPGTWAWRRTARP